MSFPTKVPFPIVIVIEEVAPLELCLWPPAPSTRRLGVRFGQVAARLEVVVQLVAGFYPDGRRLLHLRHRVSMTVVSQRLTPEVTMVVQATQLLEIVDLVGETGPLGTLL